MVARGASGATNGGSTRATIVMVPRTAISDCPLSAEYDPDRWCPILSNRSSNAMVQKVSSSPSREVMPSAGYPTTPSQTFLVAGRGSATVRLSRSNILVCRVRSSYTGHSAIPLRAKVARVRCISAASVSSNSVASCPRKIAATGGYLIVPNQNGRSMAWWAP